MRRREAFQTIQYCTVTVKRHPNGDTSSRIHWASLQLCQVHRTHIPFRLGSEDPAARGRMTLGQLGHAQLTTEVILTFWVKFLIYMLYRLVTVS